MKQVRIRFSYMFVIYRKFEIKTLPQVYVMISTLLKIALFGYFFKGVAIFEKSALDFLLTEIIFYEMIKYLEIRVKT